MQQDNVITITKNYIRNHSANDYQAFLEKVDFKRSEDEFIDDYFIRALTYCVEYHAIECCKVLYSTWEKLFNIEEIDVPYYVQLYLKRTDIRLLKFLQAYITRHFTYEEIGDILIEYIQDPTAIVALNICEQIFGRQSLGFYQEMYTRAVTENNFVVSEFLKDILKEEEVYAEYPDWVFPQENPPLFEEIDIPEEPEIVIEITNLESVAKLMLELSQLEGVEYEKEKERLTKQLKTVDKEKIKEYVKEYYLSTQSFDLSENKEMFEYFGPSHPIPGSIYEIEKRYGGSRMFLSIQNEFGEEDYETTKRMENQFFTHVHWFKGVCDKCFRKIRRYRHALRMPGISGGWSGTFCSSQCIIDTIIENNLDALYMLNLWSEIYKDILKFGIQDFVHTEQTNDFLQGKEEIQETSSVIETGMLSSITLSEDKIIDVDDYQKLGDLIRDSEDSLVFVLFYKPSDENVTEIIENIESTMEFYKNDSFDINYYSFNIENDKDLDIPLTPDLTAYHLNKVISEENINLNNYNAFLLKIIKKISMKY